MSMSRPCIKFDYYIRRDQSASSHEARLVFFYLQNVHGEGIAIQTESMAIDHWQRFDHNGGVFFLHIGSINFLTLNNDIYGLFGILGMRQSFKTITRLGFHILST